MKILYAGTSEIAVPSLCALALEFDVCAVLTTPDKASGRSRALRSSPVKNMAVELGIPVFQPTSLDTAARKQISKVGADLLAVFSYGKIFGPFFLKMFPLGGINMHPSALPKFRGPSPLTAAILAGENETALTVQRISLKMDAGDILRQIPYPLKGNETTESLSHDVSLAAAPEMVATIRAIVEGNETRIPQNHEQATYCSLLSKKDAYIDWNLPASQIERMIRAFTPWPRARTSFKGTELSLIEGEIQKSGSTSKAPGSVVGVDKGKGILIQTGEGLLILKYVQPEFRKMMDFQSFLNGSSLKEGDILG